MKGRKKKMQKENREIVPGEGMPACSCQHFQPGSNVVPSPPPLSADEAGSRGWRGISLLKEWRDGNNRSGLDPEGMFEADSGHQTGTVKTTGVSHPLLLLPGGAGPSATASQYLCEGKQLVLIAAVVSAREEQSRKSDDDVHQCISYLLTAVLELALIQDQCH